MPPKNNADQTWNQYSSHVGFTVQEQDGTALAIMLTTADSHAISLGLGMQGPNNINYNKSGMPKPWGEIAFAHAQVCKSWVSANPQATHHLIAAFDQQLALVNTFLKHSSTQNCWLLPVLYAICRDLRDIASQADEILLRNGEKPRALDETVRTLSSKAFSVCITDRLSPPDYSRRWGSYYIAGAILKLYFKLDKVPLCKNIIRAITSSPDLPRLSDFPKSHQVTYRYYIGVLAFLDDNFSKAEEELHFVIKSCHMKSQRNLELTLTYLIPLNLLKGILPSKKVLKHHPNLEAIYLPLIEALKEGDSFAYDKALIKGEHHFVKAGTYGVVERCKDLCIRVSLKKTWLALEKISRIPISALKAGMSLNGVDIDSEEVECYIANMIAKGFMKGYIAHEKQMVVLPDFLKGKPHPFPALKDVKPLVAFPF